MKRRTVVNTNTNVILRLVPTLLLLVLLVACGTNQPGNQPPVASDDTATAEAGVAVDIDVLANDSDADGDTLSITDVTAPANGTASINGGVISYTANAGYTGTDTFDYTVSDGTDEATATVTVTVGPSQNQLTANDDTATTEPETAVDIAVLDNDTVPDGVTLTSITVSTDPANGTATVNDQGTTDDLSDDTITYTPNEGFTGSDTFEYTLTDSDGTTSEPATVTVTVAAPGSPVPQADTATTPTDTPVDIDVLANDTDPDADPLLLVDVGQAENGTTEINDQGTPDDQTDDTVTYTPNTGFTGTDTFNYTVSDGTNQIDGTVTVTVGHYGGGAPTGTAAISSDDTTSGDTATVSVGGTAFVQIDSSDDTGLADVDIQVSNNNGVTWQTVAATGGTPTLGFTQDSTCTPDPDIPPAPTSMQCTFQVAVGAGVTPGDYQFRARVYDVDGNKPTSNVVTLTVQ